MRKKYLSALLFGALLVTSAGTFTSCKDYDDDINNLQEQIDKVVSDLESLKTTVEGLGGVTDVKIEGGKLLVTAGGQTVEYPLPTGEGSDVEKTVVELDGQDLKVDGKVIGQVGDKVTVNEEGYLCVNGDPTEIKAGKYAVLDNDADGVVTITLPDANGELKTVELAKASANVEIADVLMNYFVSFNNNSSTGELDIDGDGTADSETLYNIAWGSNSNGVDWKGPKGKIAANQLLIGATPTANLLITPATFNLGAQELTFVNTVGATAPVKLTASAIENSVQTAGSRAVKNPGLWQLSMEMTSDVTKDNVTSKFTSNNQNQLYALAVNGKVVTGFEFAVDTYTATTEIEDITTNSNNTGAKLNVVIPGEDETVFSYYGYANETGVSGEDGTKPDSYKDYTTSTQLEAGKTLALGGQTLTFAGSEAHKIYDAYIEIVDQDMANAYGITAEGMTITASNDAADLSGLLICIHVVDVQGKTYKEYYKVAFGKKSAAEETLAAQSFKIMPAVDYYVVNLGETFTSLTDADAAKINNNITWTVDANNSKTLANIDNSTDVKYFASLEDANAFVANGTTDKILNMTTASTIKKATYAAVELNLKDSPEVGKNVVTISLKDNTVTPANEFKKVKAEFTFTLPTFDELFTKSAAWTDGVANLSVKKNATADLMTLYNNKTGEANPVFTASEFNVIDGTATASIDGSTITITTKAVSNNALNDIKANIVYNVKEKSTLAVKSGEFTMNLQSLISGGKFVYYVDGQASDFVVNGQSAEFAAYVADGGKDGTKSGIAFNMPSGDCAFKQNEVIGKDNYEFKFDATNTNDNVSITFDDNAGDQATAAFSYGKLTIQGLAKGTYKTTMTVTYKKAVNAGGVVVYESFPIVLNVNND